MEKTADRRGAMILAAAIVAAGIAAGGFFAGRGFYMSRMADRVVTVKGLAEQDVRADLAIWTVRFVATSDSLEAAQAKIEKDQGLVLTFLREKGLAEEDMAVGRTEVIDLLAQQYRGEGASQSRYIVKGAVGVRSGKVDLLDATSRATGELVRRGVVLEQEYAEGGTGPKYIFTRLNDVKPAMIVEATANARRAAEQFAKDSKSGLGKIKRAYQGMFMILPRDGNESVSESRYIDKKVRVVSTIDYYLVR
ncbi:MAG: SIMPL domain-containing protein [Proteobacteria bacterium]|nr:SIMPL domain-containing protein [Pseudomonadota bacterium]